MSEQRILDRSCASCALFKRMYPTSRRLVFGTCQWKPPRGVVLPLAMKGNVMQPNEGAKCKAWVDKSTDIGEKP